jgi:hypothetical protein
VGLWLKQTFRAIPLPLCHETSAGSLEVRALMRGSHPRPWGEAGPPDGGPGEGQPMRIAPQNVQTLGPALKRGFTGRPYHSVEVNFDLIPRPSRYP